MSTLPSSGQEGAASAAPSPTTPEDAERLLEAATSPSQALAIYEISADREGDWRIVKLKAERRYGVLLGEAKLGRPRANVTGRDILRRERMVRNRARKVAAVPQEKFDEYIREHGASSTRQGLLREHGEAPSSPRPPKIKGPPEQRLAKKIRYLRSLSRTSMPKWSKEDMDDVEIILGGASHHPSGASTRLKTISAARKNNPGKIWDLRYQLMKIVGWLAQLDLLVWGIDESDKDLIVDLYDDLVMLDEWTTRALARASSYIDDDGIREKIRKMKENQSGRSDAEKENIKRRVAALERRLESKLSA